MVQRSVAKRQWAAAKLYETPDARLKAFLYHVDSYTTECWDDVVALLRKDYYDLFDQIVPPLVASSDKALRVQLFLHIDPKQPKELDLLRQFIRQADPVKDQPELKAIAGLNHPALQKEIAGRPEIAAVLAPSAPPRRAVTNVRPAPATAAGPPPPSKKPESKDQPEPAAIAVASNPAPQQDIAVRPSAPPRRAVTNVRLPPAPAAEPPPPPKEPGPKDQPEPAASAVSNDQAPPQKIARKPPARRAATKVRAAPAPAAAPPPPRKKPRRKPRGKA